MCRVHRVPLLVFLLITGTTTLCHAQNFEGTNLSSLEPFYRDLPYVFEGSESYFISFKSSPNVVKAIVPEPLIPIPDQALTIVFAKHRVVAPITTSYEEAYFIIPVAYGTTYGGFIPVLYLNKIETITPAREIWGYNKVGGEFQFIEKENEVSITVSQMDTLVVKATFALGESFIPSTEPEGGPAFNIKYIPSVVEHALPDVKQITMSELKDMKTTQMRLGTATLEFYASHYNPLDKIPILEIVQAGYKVNSFAMVHGEVLYDYLKKENYNLYRLRPV